MRKTQNAGALWLALVQAHPAEGFGRLPHVHEFSNVASTRTSAQNAIHHTAYGRRLRMLPWLPGPSNASSAVNSVPCTQKSGSRDTHTHTHDSLESGTLASALRSPCPFVDACKREPISHLRIKWNGLSNSGVHSNVWMLSRDFQHQLLRDFLFCDRFRFVSLTSSFQDAGHSCPSSSTGNSRGILMAAFSSRFGRLQHLSTQLTFR